MLVRSDSGMKVHHFPRHWNGASWDGGGHAEYEPRISRTVVLDTAPTRTGAKAVQQGPCTLVHSAEWDKHTTIGELHKPRGGTASFEYSTSGETIIQSGLKVGTDGGWGLSGDAESQRSALAGVGMNQAAPYHRQLQTQYKYSE
jgi:hypothetical protein